MTLYAVLIGINGYRHVSPLAGCVNDAVCAGQYFGSLCAAAGTAFEPLYLLAPADEAEAAALAGRNIRYLEPTRDNIIAAFGHFKQARAGDSCVLHFSGHGSYMPAPELFRDIEPSGQIETLVCADSRSGQAPDLMDKELAWLIAEALHNPDTGLQKTGVHFLAVMDCCHAGSNTRDTDIAVRMTPPATAPATDILGFHPAGNCLYLPFEPGQQRVCPGGLRHARYVNLAAARNTEAAQERSLSAPDSGARQRHGVFSFCLYSTLYQSGPALSYRELIRRVEMEVRNRVDHQIPLLEMSDWSDENALFLRSDFKAPPTAFEAGFRLLPGHQTEWYINGGALQGIHPSGPGGATLVRLSDGREVAVVAVRSSESVLDPAAFSPDDMLRGGWQATVVSMAAPRIRVACAADMPAAQRRQLDQALEQADTGYIDFSAAAQAPDYLARTDAAHRFYLVKPGSDRPLFMPQEHAGDFLSGVHKVGKWVFVSALANPGSGIPRAALQVQARVLEGVPFGPDTLGAIPDAVYGPLLTDPDQIEARYLNGVQPALQWRIRNVSDRNYWVGALYLSANFGISHQYLECREIGPAALTDTADAQFTSGGRVFPAIPLAIDRDLRSAGVDAIMDYWIVVVSTRRFDLSRYAQQALQAGATRSAGFEAPESGLAPDDWFTIKIPQRISTR